MILKNTIDIINNIKTASKEEITFLLDNYSEEDGSYAASEARKLTDEIFGKKIFIRGIIEFTNVCRNDCYYCGLRCSNSKVERFRLSEEEILSCCRKGHQYGIRTFVLQGGEDPFYNDERMIKIVSDIRNEFPDSAITLSLGERSCESYEKLCRAGADRYLLRHETFNAEHYRKLHPEKMSRDNRIKCLSDLKKAGFQTGCGIMVGSPYQTSENIAEDLIFMREFKPQMIGIGPFIPQKDTPFGNMPAGSVKLTLFLLSIIRLMLPKVLLPATTALGTLGSENKTDGRISGLLCGANVIMPNLSPEVIREKYCIYDNKANVKDDMNTEFEKIREMLGKAGFEIVIGRGDALE